MQPQLWAFHYLHSQNNSVFKIPNYSHVTFFKQKAKKSHICTNKAKKNHTYKRDLATANIVCLLRKQCYFLKL